MSLPQENVPIEAIRYLVWNNSFTTPDYTCDFQPYSVFLSDPGISTEDQVWVDGETLPHLGHVRNSHAANVLCRVRTRNGYFYGLVRACKAHCSDGNLHLARFRQLLCGPHLFLTRYEWRRFFTALGVAKRNPSADFWLTQRDHDSGPDDAARHICGKDFGAECSVEPGQDRLHLRITRRMMPDFNGGWYQGCINLPLFNDDAIFTHLKLALSTFATLKPSFERYNPESQENAQYNFEAKRDFAAAEFACSVANKSARKSQVAPAEAYYRAWDAYKGEDVNEWAPVKTSFERESEKTVDETADPGPDSP